MSRVARIQSINKTFYFSIYVIVTISLIAVGNYLLITDDLYYNFFDRQMSFESIAKFIDRSRNLAWIIYIITPLYLLIKFFVVAACLSVGVLLFGYNINFEKLFGIALFSDIVFIIPPLIKILWFSLIVQDFNLEHLQYFFPLSAICLVNPNQIERWLLYPLQTLNVFELLYWASLALGLKVILKESFTRMLAIVSLSYGLALLLWIIFITFITITLS